MIAQIVFKTKNTHIYGWVLYIIKIQNLSYLHANKSITNIVSTITKGRDIQLSIANGKVLTLKN